MSRSAPGSVISLYLRAYVVNGFGSGLAYGAKVAIFPA